MTSINSIDGLSEEELGRLPFVNIVEEAGIKKYFCFICDTHLANLNNLRTHVLRSHTDVKCAICEKEFPTTKKKNQHLLIAHNFGVIETKKKERSMCICDICKKEYTTKRGLQNHIAYMHTLLPCPDCEFMFLERDLPKHRNDAHKTPIPTCGICGYRNNRPHLILLHQRQVHLRERNVKCELCELVFFDLRSLRKHMIMHKPEKIHECEWCHKKFPRKMTLRMHEKIHKGVKNKVCELCGSRFVQKASLNYHMTKHHPDAC